MLEEGTGKEEGMKKVRKEQLHTCICIGIDDFRYIVREIYGNGADVIVKLDGITVQIDEEHYATDLNDKLAQYFETNEVTSVHIDDCDYPAVWIVYREKPISWIVFNQGNGITVPITKTYNCPVCHHCQSKKSRYCPYCGHPMKS